MTNSVQSVNQKLADLLGIEWRGKKVRGFEVHCHTGELPRVVVHHLLTDPGQLGDVESKVFRLEPREATAAEPPAKPFDLDRACADAMARIVERIEFQASAASWEIRHRARGRALFAGGNGRGFESVYQATARALREGARR